MGPGRRGWNMDQGDSSPRKSLYHPSEGEGGPDLATLSGKRSTVPLSVETVCDNWKSAGFDDVLLGDKLWTGRCVFNETWDDITNGTAMDRVEVKPNLPNGLVFTDVEEYSLTDDLSGEALDGHLVTLAKREEITEVYRRTVWTEAPVEDCFRDTGKPPTPVRWVVTNKGDKLHPNIRLRLVAKHLAAKYGGKASTEDLSAAMPPFELGATGEVRSETG